MWLPRSGLEFEEGALTRCTNEFETRFAGDWARAHEYAYRCLDVLDAKTAALLQFNSVLIAVWGIFVAAELQSPDRVQLGIAGWLLAGVFALSSHAMLLSTLSIWVRWTPASELADLHGSITRLLAIRNRRTVFYRRAFGSSLASLLALLLFAAQFHVRKLPESFWLRDWVLAGEHVIPFVAGGIVLAALVYCYLLDRLFYIWYGGSG